LEHEAGEIVSFQESGSVVDAALLMLAYRLHMDEVCVWFTYRQIAHVDARHGIHGACVAAKQHKGILLPTQ
jgi:hypothetical protein